MIDLTPAEWWHEFHMRAAAGIGPAQPRSPELQNALDEAGRIFGDSSMHRVIDINQARATQRALDASLQQRIPVGEAREIDPADLMPFERDALFADFADTVPAEFVPSGFDTVIAGRGGLR